MYDPKYHVGHSLKHVWVFGGVCREADHTEKLFMKRVLSRKITDLDPLIRAGSIINSDSARVYKHLLKRLGGDQGLAAHYTVNHRRRQFVSLTDTGDKITTNTIEAHWSKLKINILSTHEFTDEDGQNVKFVDGYIARYVYFRNK